MPLVKGMPVIVGRDYVRKVDRQPDPAPLLPREEAVVRVSQDDLTDDQIPF